MSETINHLERYEVVDGCWEYTGPLNTSGYPNTGANRLGHRLSYEYHIGSIPEGMLVCHRCGNRKCINPDHLYAGTPKENYADRYKHGTQNKHKGEKNPRAKVTEEMVKEIRASDLDSREAAQKFGISRGSVYQIRSRYTWSHI